MSQTQVQSGFIGDNSITAAQIAAGAVGTTEIAADAVGTTEIAADAVTTAKIADSNITTAKLNSIVSASLVPTGAVFHFAASTAPTGYLKANGDTIPNGTGTVQGITANFSALYAIIGSTYGAAGQLPDLRGEFLRGWDDSRGVDSGRTFGSTQAQQTAKHKHAGFGENIPGFWPFGQTNSNGKPGSGGRGDQDNFYFYTNDGSDVDNAMNAAGVIGNETRPRNRALLACIKY
jgi:microcystin-dependent protein